MRTHELSKRSLKLTPDGERAWVTPVLQKASLGHAVTGWTPRRISVSDGIEVYWVRLKDHDIQLTAVVIRAQPAEEGPGRAGVGRVVIVILLFECRGIPLHWTRCAG